MNTESKNNDSKHSYVEKIWLNIFVIIAVIILEGILIAVAVTVSISSPSEMMVTIPLCSGIGVFLLLIFINYSHIRIAISDTEIKVKYGIINKKSIKIDELASYKETKAPFRTYLGFGVRVGTDGSLAFTTRFGKAIRFEAADTRPLVVTSNNPEAIIEFINKIKNK